MDITANNCKIKTMILVLLSSLWLLLHVIKSESTCKKVDYSFSMQRNKENVKFILGTFPKMGLAECVRECMLVKMCKSFSFEHVKGKCKIFKYDMEDYTLKEKKGTVTSNIKDWPLRFAGPCEYNNCSIFEACQVTDAPKTICVSTNCSTPPDIPKTEKEFNVATATRALGTVLPYRCAPGFMTVGYTTIICLLPSLSWRTFACDLPRTCFEVKLCNESYSDGEYWIYPVPYKDKRVRIYCYGMIDNSTVEFVSLPAVNRGFYPSLSDEQCGKEADVICPGNGGETLYSKIRVDITTMDVIRSDTTFATTVSGITLMYGEANYCILRQENKTKSCGPKGEFIINTKGTGLVVSDESYLWLQYGSFLCNVFRRDPTDCEPIDPLKLELNLDDELSDSNVTIPCV